MRIREIEISNTAPSADRLWLRPVSGGFETLVLFNGRWREVSQTSGGSAGPGGGGMTDEEKSAIERAIASASAAAGAADGKADAAQTAADKAKTAADKAQAAADAAGKKAQEALAKAEEGGKPTTAGQVALDTEDANLQGAGDVKAALEKIAAKVWYTKIAISSCTAVPAAGSYEIGGTVSKPTLTWKTSKPPVKTVVNGVTLTSPSQTSYTMPSDIKATKAVSLTVTDEAGGTDTKSLTWTFAYGVYEGMAATPAEITQDWIKKTLGGKSLKTSAKGTYTMKGSDSKYWWIAAPTAWSVSFSTTLGAGGATKYGAVADFVNDQGAKVPMTVYRAEQIQGSDMSITVK